MTRETLIEALSDLRDYHAVSKKTCESLGLNLLQNPDHYSAENDSRISKLFDYVSPTKANFQTQVDYAAFAIIANIARFHLHIPTHDQMIKMLAISGYSGEEMKEYILTDSARKAKCLSSKHLIPTVYLLSRLLSDAMMDRSVWQGYKKGKKKKNYSPAPNPSMQKLASLVSYMEENHLLSLDRYDSEDYDKFVISRCRYICQILCVDQELKRVSDEIERRQHELSEEGIREINRLMKNQAKGKSGRTNMLHAKNAAPAPIAPLAAPSPLPFPVPSPQQISPSLSRPKPPSLWDMDKDLKAFRGMSPEIESIFKRMEQFDDEAADLQEDCWDTMDQLTEESSARQAKFVSDLYMPTVAMGAFLSLLDGDDIYRLKVGASVMEDLFTMSEMPLPCGFLEELEDEDDWDYQFTDCNGKLALPVVKDGDCLTFPISEDVDVFQFTLPVSAMISRYANRPFEAPLYIRKSLIKMFKEYGCSERKARDFAVIIATLNQVSDQEEEDSRLAADYPSEKSPEETPEQKADARIQAERVAREEVERQLKLAKKENQSCRHEISVLQREIEKLKKQLTAAEPATGSPLRIPEQIRESDEDDVKEPGRSISDETIEYPFRTKLRVVLYGGFEVFHRELLKLLPDVRIVETASHIDVNPIRNADLVFLQTNKTDHSGYWTVRDACKINNVPYIHLNYASAKRCAAVMVTEIRNMTGQQSEPAES